MYSWPLPEEPSRLDRQMNILRGKLAGSSGASQANLMSPLFSWLPGSLSDHPGGCCFPRNLQWVRLSWGALGNQPMRSALML